eukprot:TRINITY_DN74116_c0_g1_i1.p1 TRINITY_DN74116_c0_g1~~TRINITY_DN74116_c0_g1_i1.p1  ORF type:complete len:577 (-),score=85.38 TRINITY_DN74116_c0_g1_i1:320-2050(-)
MQRRFGTSPSQALRATCLRPVVASGDAPPHSSLTLGVPRAIHSSFSVSPPQFRGGVASISGNFGDRAVRRRPFASWPSQTAAATSAWGASGSPMAAASSSWVAPRSSATPAPLHAPVPLTELDAVVERLRDDAPPEVLEWMKSTLTQLKHAQKDQAALMKRNWSDSPFEEGESGNEKTIESFELELVGMLRNARNGLGDSEVLGSAIDLAGAYKKNYKLENSEAVLLRCTRHSEERGGAWQVKYLNHISQVRMKQARNVEGLEMMYEMESLATFTMDEPGGSNFYETLYRNMSCALRSLHREDEAALYFAKMVQASSFHKPTLDWMDLWELGLLIANRAYQNERWPEFYKARSILADALRMQKIAEPNELILRAKVLSNLGQCFLATGEHEEADIHYTEAYNLFNDTVGKRSPLFGMQAWACGNLRCAEKRYAEALHFLGEALYVEVVSDGLSVPEMSKLIDQILSSLHEKSDSEGNVADCTRSVQRALDTLITDPRWASLEETVELAVLAHKMSLFHISAQWSDLHARNVAKQYSSRAVAILRLRGDVSKDSQRWLQQATLIHESLFEPRNRHVS